MQAPSSIVQAIFSDDSDNEGESTSLNKVEDPGKKIEAATTTLNRLIAGDFLESLGKELGLEVPPEMPYSTNKAQIPASQRSVDMDTGDANTLPVHNNPPPTPISRALVNHEEPHDQEIAQVGRSGKNELIHGNSDRTGSIYMENSSSEKNFNKVNPEKIAQEDKKAARTTSGHHQNWNNSSSSEDERSRKRSGQHRHRSSGSDSGDSSIDHRDRHHSRSKGRKNESSREKSSSSRRHSKHHKQRRSRDSPAKSRHDSKREHGESKRDRRKRRD